jgi:hypothetical protein
VAEREHGTGVAAVHFRQHSHQANGRSHHQPVAPGRFRLEFKLTRLGDGQVVFQGRGRYTTIAGPRAGVEVVPPGSTSAAR